MKIILNNKEEVFETTKEKLSISEIRQQKKFTFNHLIVKINSKLVKKADYDSSFVKDGDKVDIIHLISGG